MPRIKRPHAASIEKALRDPTVRSVRVQLMLKPQEARRLHGELQRTGKRLTTYVQDAIDLKHKIAEHMKPGAKLVLEEEDGTKYTILL